MNFESSFRRAIFFLVVSTMTFVGCGETSKKKEATGISPTPNGPGVFGLLNIVTSEYTSECKIEDGRSERLSIAIHETTFERTYMNFDGPDCDETKHRTTYVYKLSHVENRSPADVAGWTTFSFIYDATMAAPNSSHLTEIFNSKNVYGFSNWELNQPKDVSGLKYDSTSTAKLSKGTLRWSTIKTDGVTLLLARYNKNDVASPENPLVFKKIK